MEAHQIRALLSSYFNIDADKRKIEDGILSSRVSLSQAYGSYGRKRVDTWIAKGMIKTQKNGLGNSKVTLDRIQLRILDETDNRAIFLED